MTLLLKSWRILQRAVLEGEPLYVVLKASHNRKSTLAKREGHSGKILADREAVIAK